MEFHAFFSEKASRHLGTACIYADAEGNEVEVTYVAPVTGESLEEIKTGYKWDDVVYLGKVTKWVRNEPVLSTDKITRSLRRTYKRFFTNNLDY